MGSSPPPGDYGDPPGDLADRLAALDDAELEAVVAYAQHLRQSDSVGGIEIEAGQGEEIVRVEDRGGYTEVVKRQPCVEGCAECPHGPYLYVVTREPRPEGGEKLHWAYVGEVSAEE